MVAVATQPAVRGSGVPETTNPGHNDPGSPGGNNPGGGTGVGGAAGYPTRGNIQFYLGTPGAPAMSLVDLARQQQAYNNQYGLRTALVDQNNNFLGGDAQSYADWYAGAQPNGAVGQYSDAQSQAERAQAQSNYGAGLANNDLAKNNLAAAFAEILQGISKSKTRSLSSLADSAADRGMTSSGIFLKSTDDTNDRYNEQTASQTRQKDAQNAQLEQDRVNLSNALAQAQVTADTGAFNRALQAWKDKQAQAVAQAAQYLKELGV